MPRERDINLGIKNNNSQGIIGSVIGTALLPLQTMVHGFYEGIGSNFGDRFAEGLNKVLDEDLDISFERKGEVTGKAISYTATSGLEQFNEDTKNVSSSFTDLRYAVEDGQIDVLAQKFDVLFKNIIKSVTGIGDSYVRGFRKGSVQIEALRKIEAEIASGSNIAPDLKGKKKVIYTVGGFAGDDGMRGKAIAEQLKPLVNDDTEVIGAENKFTDVKTSADINELMWGINSLANVAKINLKGFNPDAVKLAAQVVNTLAKNPDVVVDLVGHSAGGYVVEETQEILNLLGKGDKVKSRTVGTPNVKGGLNASGTSRTMGSDDPFSEYEKKAEYLGIATPTEKVAKGVKDHSFQAYVDSDEAVAEILGDSLNPERLKNQRRKSSKFKGKLVELESLYVKYISTVISNLDDLGEELSVAPDRLVAKRRRARLQDRGVNEVNRKLERDDFKPIKVSEGTETAVLTIGGFSGAKGGSGTVFARRLGGLVKDDKTQYIGVRNPFTDVVTPEEIENPDLEKTVPKILEMFGKVHAMGYNPDSAEIAAQVMDLLKKNPNLKVKVAGYSGGGYVAEDVMELLRSAGADMKRVEVMGVGTPNLPGGIKQRDFLKVLGKNDPIMGINQLKAINDKVKDILGFDIFPELMTKLQNIDGIDSHNLEDYVANSTEVQNFLYGHIPDGKELLDNYGQIQNLKSQIAPVGEQLEAVQQDKSLTSPERLKRLKEIRATYIDLLTQIHALAKRSREIGGGRFFKGERENAVAELETAGIIVEPPDPREPEPAHEDTNDLWEEEESEVINDRAAKMARKYREYLLELKKQSNRDVRATGSIVSEDFKNLTKSNQQSYIQSIRTAFNTKARVYRDAVKYGQLEIAKSQGEELIKLAATIKRLYSNLKDDADIDPEVKKSLSGYARYATSVQNEVVEGAGGPRRANVGLVGLFEDQLNLAESDGEDVAEGFIYAILDSLARAKDAGEQLVDAVDEGIREQGEIKSPSKLAARLGRWFTEGFVLGMRNEDLEESGREVIRRSIEGIEDESERTSAQGTPRSSSMPELLQTEDITPPQGEQKVLGFFKGIQKFHSSILQQYPLLKKIQGTIAAIAGLFLGGLGVNLAITAFKKFGGEALDTAMQVEALNRSIIFVSRSSAIGAKNLEFISQAAKNMSADLNVAKKAYAGFLGASKNTAIEGAQTDRIFTAFAAAAANRGLDAQSQGRLFTAVEQIISKRYLGAEEVRGQIGDVFPGFEGILSEALGVESSQLSSMMQNRELGLDVLPKVAAVLEAQNASVEGIQTAQMAQTKYNNSLLEFKTLLGLLLQPLQKFSFNVLSDSMETLTDNFSTLLKILRNAIFVVLIGLYGQVNLVTVAVNLLGKAIHGLILIFSRLWASKMVILAGLAKLAATYLLVAAAMKTVSNLIGLSKNQYQELNDDVDRLTASMGRYSQAIKDAAENQGKLDFSSGELKLNEGIKLPGWLQGIAGGERLNLDNLVRKRLNWLYDRTDGNLLRYGPLGYFMKDKPGFTTEAERRQDDFQVATGDLNFRNDQLLVNDKPATDAAGRITAGDRAIALYQSKRLELLPGDKEGLEASLAAEREINTQRDKDLKILTNYQQSLSIASASNKKALEELESGYANGVYETSVYEFTKAALLNREEANAQKLEEINGILSKVTKTLSEFQRQLRNSNERIANFIERRGLSAQSERTEIITKGIELGEGERVIQLKLEDASRREISDYISELEKTIATSTKRLESGALSEGYRLVSESAETNGLTLDSATIDRMLSEEERSRGELDALGELKALRENKVKLSQYAEQLAQNLQTNRNSLIDFNRTIFDYFSRITQQIKEAALETQRLISQLLYTDIKNTLRGAIAPGSNTFVNGVIDNIQSVLDGASAIAQKAFGDLGTQLSFEMEVQSLAIEMNEFIRQIGSAGDALENFVSRLGVSSRTSAQGTPPNLAERDSAPKGLRSRETRVPQDAKRPESPLGTMGLSPRSSVVASDEDKSGYYNNATANQYKNYITKILKQPAGVDTGVEQMLRTRDLGSPDTLEMSVSHFQGNSSYVSSPANIYGQAIPKDPDVAAPQLNSELIERKRFNLELQKYSTEQEREAYINNADNIIETNSRLIKRSIKENQRTLIDLEGKFENFSFQYDYASAGNELKKALRDVKTTFLDTNSDIDMQIQNTEDAILTINNLTKKMPGDIARLRVIGTDEALKLADVQLIGLNDLLVTLPTLQNNLAKIKQLQNGLPEVEKKGLEFTERQGELKIEIEAINKKSAISNIKSNLAAEVGTIEQIKQTKLEQERYRLKQAIASIELNEKPSPERDELIANERKQSILNTENIEFDSRFNKLDLEKRSIDYESSIGEKNAGFHARVGFDIKADAIRKQSAIAQEENRFRRDLLELEKKYRYQPKLLEEFTREATELNRVNLDSIENQFKSLGKTVEDYFIGSTQGFFNKFVTEGISFVAGEQNDRQVLEERLRYAEELNQLSKQHKDEPGKLAHLKNRARELNETKLDQIRSEFNLFSNTVNLAKQAVMEFVKQLAAMVARAAAAKFLTSILGGALGGSSGASTMSGGGGIGAFVADKGATVGDRKIGDRTTSIMRKTFPGVAKAWSDEGSGAQLGVFHIGEELLSRKTGEASRYQALKRKYGINPLGKILNYSEGGTLGDVSNNILSGFTSSRPRIDLSGLPNRNGGASSRMSKTINITQQISTPNADSFRLNEDQRNQDLLATLRRGI